jgi:hypothetical protein
MTGSSSSLPSVSSSRTGTGTDIVEALGLKVPMPDFTLALTSGSTILAGGYNTATAVGDDENERLGLGVGIGIGAFGGGHGAARSRTVSTMYMLGMGMMGGVSPLMQRGQVVSVSANVGKFGRVDGDGGREGNEEDVD